VGERGSGEIGLPAFAIDSLEHGLDHLPCHIGAHTVIDATAREDYLRVIADRLSLVGKIIGINANAVAADKARELLQQQLPTLKRWRQ